jgi:glycosyltransferase involved in cell wall biosynthesis
MRILYHMTMLPPPLPGAEAISQEVGALQRTFGGRVIYLNPNARCPVHVPRLLFGFHQLRQIRLLEDNLDLHHLYNPDPFPYPVLRRLRHPAVYSLTGGVRSTRLNRPFFAALEAVTVPDEESLNRTRAMGLHNVWLVRPGIDTARFSYMPASSNAGIRLLMGSAPWARSQFRSKGVDALLSAARQMPQLHLVFLWRGVLADEMDHRVRRAGLIDRVEVLNREVNVNEVLATVHATVALATRPAIVRAYPHSLMESLAAGKPVIVSQAIPMAAYVRGAGCGTTVAEVTPESLVQAIQTLTSDYRHFQQAALEVGSTDFTIEAMLSSYREVYEHVLQ